jgi:hypothetical protein
MSRAISGIIVNALYESEYLHHCGVGKTTFAREFRPNYANCRPFISADPIAVALSRIKGRYFDASFSGRENVYADRWESSPFSPI